MSDDYTDDYFSGASILLEDTVVQSSIATTRGDGTVDLADWYKITLDSYGKVNVIYTPLGGFNAAIYLYTEGDTGSQIKSSTSYATTELLTDGLMPGVYYIKVEERDNPGNYTIKYSQMDEPQPTESLQTSPANDHFSGAASISSDVTYTTNIDYVASTGVRDQADWYKFTLDRYGKVNVTYTPLGGFNAAIYLYAEGDTGSQIKSSTSYATTELLTDWLMPGVYYIKVEERSNPGNYTIKYSQMDEPQPTASLQTSPANDHFSGAASISSDVTYTTNINYVASTGVRDQADWYKFYLSEGRVDISYSPHSDFISKIYLYRESSTSSHIAADTSYDGDAILLTVNNLSAGYYYLMVARSSGSGVYSLNVNKVYPSIENLIQQAVLEERARWDVDGDGNIGLAEAIQALKIVVGQ